MNSMRSTHRKLWGTGRQVQPDFEPGAWWNNSSKQNRQARGPADHILWMPA